MEAAAERGDPESLEDPGKGVGVAHQQHRLPGIVLPKLRHEVLRIALRNDGELLGELFRERLRGLVRAQEVGHVDRRDARILEQAREPLRAPTTSSR